MRRLRYLLPCLLALPAPAPCADDSPARAALTYDHGRVSARLERVPLEDVVAALTDETGITFEGELGEPRQVSKVLEAVPLPEALDRLLGSQNFVLVYDAAGEPRRVRLLGGPQPRAGAPAPDESPAGIAMRRLAALPPEPVPPRVAKAVGAQTLRVNRLMTTAARNRDPAVRAEARDTLLRAMNRDAELRRALGGMEHAQLAALLGGRQGPQRAELAAALLRGVQDDALRDTLRTVLEKLRRDASPTAGHPPPTGG